MVLGEKLIKLLVKQNATPEEKKVQALIKAALLSDNESWAVPSEGDRLEKSMPWAQGLTKYKGRKLVEKK